MAQARRVRIGTFNVHGFVNRRASTRILQQADVVAASGVDVVGLQEVSTAAFIDDEVVSGIDTFARRCGLLYSASSPVTVCGNSVLSRWPISWAATVELPSHSSSHCCHARYATAALIELPDKGGRLLFIVTHLDHVSEAARAAQWAGLQRWLGATPVLATASHVVVGDLNAVYRPDYAARRWAEIRAIRQDRDLPPPESRVLRLAFRGGSWQDGESEERPPPAHDRAVARVEGAEEWDVAPMYGSSEDASDGQSHRYHTAPHEPERLAALDPEDSVEGTCAYGTRVDWILVSNGRRPAAGAPGGPCAAPVHKGGSVADAATRWSLRCHPAHTCVFHHCDDETGGAVASSVRLCDVHDVARLRVVPDSYAVLQTDSSDHALVRLELEAVAS